MTKQEIEAWVNKLADAFLSGPNESTEAARERMFRDVDPEQQAEIRAYVADQRKAAAKAAKAEAAKQEDTSKDKK